MVKSNFNCFQAVGMELYVLCNLLRINNIFYLVPLVWRRVLWRLLTGAIFLGRKGLHGLSYMSTLMPTTGTEAFLKLCCPVNQVPR